MKKEELKKDKEPIAIVGVGCKMPAGVHDTESFWKILENEECVIKKVPLSRWDTEAFYHPDPAVRGKINTEYIGTVTDEDLEEFDPFFFGIAPVAAQKMDVQQRWMLEVCFRAIEDSGHSLDELSGSDTGVFVGVSAKEYGELVMSDSVREIIDGNSILGNSSSIVSNRVSYTFNLKGPSFTVDTACSSSLVALHVACQGIWNNEFSAALVGGVNAIIAPEVSLAFSAGGYLAADGLCKAFDHRANGYVRSEGAGAVYLKPLSQALKDNDKIYATVVGSALNQDGNTPGISYPNRDSQVKVIQAALKSSGIPPEEIQYVEAHGTGTPVGDKVEATALGLAIGSKKNPGDQLYLGSVKTNFGHLESASGMAGLLKLILAMKKKTYPKSLHIEKLNPEIPFDMYNLEVLQKAREWKAVNGVRTGGANSFGFGGTNAHIILQSRDSYPYPEQSESAPLKHSLLTLSAKSPKALQQVSDNFLELLTDKTEIPALDDLCYSANLRQTHFNNRIAVPAESLEQLEEMLKLFREGGSNPDLVAGKSLQGEHQQDVVFVFSGQGAQWWRMGRDLILNAPVFKGFLDECEAVMQEFCSWSLTEELLKEESESLMHTEISQPALLAIQISLSRYWQYLGIEPGAVVGHSIGEVAAAFTAGIINMRDAFKIVYYRMGILERISDKGTMLAVGVSYETAKGLILDYADSVEVGTINGPGLVTLTGEEEPLKEIAASLEKQEVFHRFLKVTGPFHSRFLEPMEQEIKDLLKDIEWQMEQIPVYSCVAGGQDEDLPRDPHYWYRNLREVVRFSEAVEACVADGYHLFIEINAHPILSPYVLEIVEKSSLEGVVLPSLNRKEDDFSVFNRSLASLYVHGFPIEWKKIHLNRKQQLVRFPEYPFQKERYWFEKYRTRQNRLGRKIHPFIDKHIESVRCSDDHLWEINLDKRLIPYIAEHVVQGNIIFPAAGLSEMALGCGFNAFGEQFGFIEDINFSQGVYLPSGEDEIPDIQFNLTGEDGCFTVFSRDKGLDGPWRTHCTGYLRHKNEVFESSIPKLEEVQPLFLEEHGVDFNGMYRQMHINGLQLGPSFTAIDKAWKIARPEYLGEAFGVINTHETNIADLHRYYIHPGVLDSCWQILIPAIVNVTQDDEMLALPVHVERIKYHGRPSAVVTAYGRLLVEEENTFKGNIWVYDDKGECCLEIQGFTVKHIEGTGKDLNRKMSRWIYSNDWTLSSESGDSREDAAAEESDSMDLPPYLEDDGLWVIIGNSETVTESAHSMLSDLNQDVVFAHTALSCNRREDSVYLNPEDESTFAQFAEWLSQTRKTSVKGVLHFGALSSLQNGDISISNVTEVISAEALGIIYLYKHLNRLCSSGSSRIWICTAEGACIESGSPVQVSQGSVIGVARVAMHEYPAIGTSIIDFSCTQPGDDEWEQLRGELLSAAPAEEAAFRGAKHYLCRFEKIQSVSEPSDEVREQVNGKMPYEVKCHTMGNPDAIYLRQSRSHKTGPGEVKVQVQFAGLSQRDCKLFYQVEKDFEARTPDRRFIGLEYSGKVLETGSSVTSVKVGETVFFLADQSLCTEIVLPEDLVFSTHNKLSPETAAALPYNYLTIGLSLIHTARIKAGDSLLVLYPANGLAAPIIQLANVMDINLTILLDGQNQLAASHKQDNIRFVTDLAELEILGGVDILLNCGPESVSYRHMQTVKRYGCVIELNKKNVLGNSRLSLSPFTRNLTFSVLDPEDIIKDDAPLCRKILLSMIELLGTQEKVIGKVTQVPVAQLGTAVRTMGEHCEDKLVVDFLSDHTVPLAPFSSFSDFLRTDGSYAITGGSSGLGLYLARHLANYGVDSLILISRSGPKSPEDKQVIQSIIEDGVRVFDLRCDISDYEQLSSKLKELGEPAHRIRGIIHCAAVFDDALIPQMDRNRFLKSLNPKAVGAWNLHEWSKDRDLDFYVLFSSVSAAYGNPSQTNYAAANLFLDQLSHYRRSLGLCCTSVSWGVIGGVGFVSHNDHVARMLESQGWKMLYPEEVAFVMEKMILQGHSHRMAMDLNWEVMGAINPADKQSYRFGHLIQSMASEGQSQGTLKDTVLGLPADTEKYECVVEAVAQQLGKILGTNHENFDLDDNILSLGIDSLMINQLRNWILSQLDIDYSMMKLMKGMSITDLSRNLVEILENPEAGDLSESADPGEELFLKPISRTPSMEYYPVSASQRRLLVLDQIDHKHTAYNINYGAVINGPFDTGRALSAFSELVKRHEVLRTSFHLVDDAFFLKVHDNVSVDVQFEETSEEDALGYVENFIRPFDLAKAPLCRALILKVRENKHILVMDIHHTIVDGNSGAFILRDYLGLYSGQVLPDYHLTYRDFTVWQKNLLDTDYLKRQHTYWMEHFKTPVQPLQLPLDYPRPKNQVYDGDDLSFELNSKVSAAVKRLGEQVQATPYMVLLGIFKCLLHKYSGQNDLVVGVPISARRHPDLEQMPGMMVNTLAIRTLLQPDRSFKEYLEGVRDSSLGAYANQDYPFENIVEGLALKRDISRNPLFDVSFTFGSTESNIFDQFFSNKSMVESAGFESIERFDYKKKKALFDISLDGWEEGEQIHFKLNFNTKLFSGKTMERFALNFIQIAKSVVQHPDTEIRNLPFLSKIEKEMILKDFNCTDKEYGGPDNLATVFESAAERFSDNRALICQDREMSYSALNELANQIASAIISVSGDKNPVVGIYMNRSMQMIASILGVLKAGGAYLPLDLKAPEIRNRFILTDSNCSLVMCDQEFRETVQGLGSHAVLCPGDSAVKNGDIANPSTVIGAHDLCYVIYTSGTTAEPKGVMIEHGSAVNRLNWMNDQYPLSSADVLIQKTPVTFDVSVWELFWWSWAGASLALLEPEDHKSPQKLTQAIGRYGVSVIHFVPSMLNEFLKHLYSGIPEETSFTGSLRQVFASGEALTIQQVGLFYNVFPESVGLANLYGPTEATVDVSFYDCTPRTAEGSFVPLGKPIANCQLYILTQGLSLAPIGVVGEIVIGGIPPARGYLNREELTKEKFIGDPFTKGGTLYRTGDLGRWTSDGNIEFLGRLDDQVKIRGLRVELGEIECVIEKHPKVQECCLVSKTDNQGNTDIAAYIQVLDDQSLSKEEVAGHIKESLPEYMVPGYILFVDQFYQTSHGKTDRSRLPEIRYDLIKTAEYTAPSTRPEITMSRIWMDLLELEQAGIQDNFFDLGGNSIKAIQLISRIHREFGVRPEVADIFTYPVLKGLVRRIGSLEKSAYSGISVTPQKEAYPVSSAQKRIFILKQLEGQDSTVYNMPVFLTLTGKLQKDKLISAFATLEQRHESLRTNFKIDSTGIVQFIHPECRLRVEYCEDESASHETVKNEFVRPFDLTTDCLIRVKLVKTGEEKHLLCLDTHHIISDGFSIQLLIKELGILADGQLPGEPQLQYRDYSVWQQSESYREQIQASKDFWLSIHSGYGQGDPLRTDFQRTPDTEYSGAQLRFQLEPELGSAVEEYCIKTGITPFMFYLAVWNLLLAKYNHSKDIAIGIPVLGRSHQHLEDIVGMFINTLALRQRVESDMTFASLLDNVKHHVLSAFQHDQYQFDDLVDDLELPRDLSRNPLFDVFFNWQERPALPRSGVRMGDVDIEVNKVTLDTSKFDLHITGYQHDGTENGVTSFSIDYGTHLFKPETINGIIAYYVNLLKDCLSDPAKTISKISLLSKEEEKLLAETISEGDFQENQSYGSIVPLFEQIAEAHPNQTALTCGERTLTYAQLQLKSTQLAHTLVSQGVKQGVCVAVFMDRSIELVIALLGILKAGGAYVPIDPDYPEQRVRLILQDSAIQLALSMTEYSGRCENLPVSSLLFLDKEESYNSCITPVAVDYHADDLAYILYTSGSTGKPKGVMVQNRGLVNHLSWHIDTLNLSAGDHILNQTSVSFDPIAREMWSALLSGGNLIILPRELSRDAIGIADFIRMKGLHFKQIQMVPSLTRAVLDAMSDSTQVSCEFLMSCGEPLSPDLVNACLEKGIQSVVNVYGPTETTLHTTADIYDQPLVDQKVYLGRPIANTHIYIMNGETLCPPGIAGEICIGGVGVSKGYLNQPELTRTQFVPDPYKHGNLLYKTGDLGRWTEEGRLEFLGRLDHQVKIRGNRIEIFEVEQRLGEVEGIKACALSVENDSLGQSHLNAFLVSDGRSISSETLRNQLSKTLPEYMIPSKFSLVKKLPILVNGKVDRSRLNSLESTLIQSSRRILAESETERLLSALWSELLGVKDLSIADHFFEIGGNSLLAVQLIMEISRETGKKLHIRDLFMNPTIRELATILDEAEKSTQQEYSDIPPVETADFYTVTSAQRQMFLLNETSGSDLPVYNMPFFLTLSETLPVARLKSVFKALIKRHPSLRTNFRFEGQDVVQFVNPERDMSIPVRQIRSEELDKVKKDFVRPFNLEKDSLIRVEVFDLDNKGTVLAIDLHHIIGDGASNRILIEDFMKLYNNENLPELPLRYIDYSQWVLNNRLSPASKAAREYWQGLLKDSIPQLNLPLDFPRPAVRNFAGSSVSFTLGEDRRDKVEHLCRELKISPYVFYLSAYFLLLSQYSHQKEIVIGTPVAGRNHPDLSKIVGNFINVICLCINLTEDMSPVEFLRSVNSRVHQSLKHDSYAFEDLVSDLSVHTDPGRNPVFDVMFSWQNVMDRKEQRIIMDGLSVEWEKPDEVISKLDLMLSGYPQKDDTVFTFEYALSLFRRETIEQMGNHYLLIVDQVVEAAEAVTAKQDANHLEGAK